MLAWWSDKDNFTQIPDPSVLHSMEKSEAVFVKTHHILALFQHPCVSLQTQIGTITVTALDKLQNERAVSSIYGQQSLTPPNPTHRIP